MLCGDLNGKEIQEGRDILGVWGYQIHTAVYKRDIPQFRSVQSLSRVQLFATPWNATRQASVSITNARSLPRLMSIESVMASSHLIPFSRFPSFPASGSFPVSQLFSSGGQRIGVSASAPGRLYSTEDSAQYIIINCDGEESERCY